MINFMKAESNLGGLLGKSSRLLSNTFNSELIKHGVTVEQWTLLAVLWDEDHQSQKALQAALLKDKATISSLINYLVKSDFVSKCQDKKDKRSFVISLTAKGRGIQGITIPIAIKSIGIATKNINKNDLETTYKVLNQIIINLIKEHK